MAKPLGIQVPYTTNEAPLPGYPRQAVLRWQKVPISRTAEGASKGLQTETKSG